jgi:hypothetical protein
MAHTQKHRSKTLIRDMVKAAQASYTSNPEYGLTDTDMKVALLAALAVQDKEKPCVS